MRRKYNKEELLEVVSQTFPDYSQAEIMAILNLYYGENSREYIQLVILKLSRGNLNALRHYVELARKDWREVLTEFQYQGGKL